MASVLSTGSSKGRKATSNGSQSPAAVTMADLQRQLAEARAERDRLQTERDTAVATAQAMRENGRKPLSERKARVTVGPKGTIAVGGMRRFPISLYAAEWTWLRDVGFPALEAFAEKHGEKLAEWCKAENETEDEYIARRKAFGEVTRDRSVFSQPNPNATSNS